MSKETIKMIEPASLLAEMEQMERFNGTTEKSIHENWYQLKTNIAQLLVKEEQEGEDATP